MNCSAKFKEYSGPVLRYSMVFVFLYFSISQFMNAKMWTGYVPEFLTGIASAQTFVYINASVEMILGIMLLLGLYTRIVALLLGLHLLVITISIGWDPIGIRDLGLSLATLVVAMNGSDRWCLKK